MSSRSTAIQWVFVPVLVAGVVPLGWPYSPLDVRVRPAFEPALAQPPWRGARSNHHGVPGGPRIRRIRWNCAPRSLTIWTSSFFAPSDLALRHRQVDSVGQLLSEWARERPDIDTSPIGLVARVVRISALLTRSAERWLAPLGLAWESFSLIATLRRAGEPFQLRPLELLQDSLLSSGAMTNRIDRVEALGLVVRLRDPNDRRGVIVQLTPKGRKLADQAIEVHVSELKMLLSGLHSADRRALTKLMSSWLSELEEMAS